VAVALAGRRPGPRQRHLAGPQIVGALRQAHPFAGEQHVAVAISTKKYDDSLSLSEDIWEIGGVPRESFVSPWAVHSPRNEDLVAWQGRVTDEFVDRVIDSLAAYLR
jgi:hypothetical protein